MCKYILNTQNPSIFHFKVKLLQTTFRVNAKNKYILFETDNNQKRFIKYVLQRVVKLNDTNIVVLLTRIALED